MPFPAPLLMSFVVALSPLLALAGMLGGIALADAAAARLERRRRILRNLRRPFARARS